MWSVEEAVRMELEGKPKEAVWGRTSPLPNRVTAIAR
jgi:hypothetical protein